jgi:hypothetical protein
LNKVASGLAIRTIQADEYDEIGQVWIENWVSTGLDG